MVDGLATSSAFTVNSGILNGGGSIDSLTIASSGTFAPGDFPETLFSDDTVFSNGDIYIWEINDMAGTVEENPDLLDITRSLSITSTDSNPFTIALTSLTSRNESGDVFNFDDRTDYRFIIANTTDGINGFLSDGFILDTAEFLNALHRYLESHFGCNSLTIPQLFQNLLPMASSSVLVGMLVIAFNAVEDRVKIVGAG